MERQSVVIVVAVILVTGFAYIILSFHLFGFKAILSVKLSA